MNHVEESREDRSGWSRLVRPRSAPRRGTVFMGIEDVEVRRATAAGLFLLGLDVESLCGFGVLCVRLVGAPASGPFADVLVWDVRLGPVCELEAMWRRYADGVNPALVVVSDAPADRLVAGVQLCSPEPARIVAGVERALEMRSAQPS
jgi:hypothetical protein